MASLVYALVSAVLLIIVKELNLKYMNKIRMPIPMEIIIVSDTRVVSQTPQETVPPQTAHHVEHLYSEYDVTPTRPGVRKWAIPTKDTSGPQLVPVRLYLHPDDAEDEGQSSCWGDSLLS